jgi:UDPglucose 6-dehydrogenase
MRIVVLGLWHLGCVTAACAAKFQNVVGLDFDRETVAKLRQGEPPLFEPGLAELISEGLISSRLRFLDDCSEACRGADLLWVCFDTPINTEDRLDLTPVLNGIERCVPYLAAGTLILISSQVPAGTCRSLEQRYPAFRFAYVPENLRLGKAISIFLAPDRIVLGVRTESDAIQLRQLLGDFSKNLVCVRTESAEMIKHAINTFLALSIAFMNEVSCVCELVGADAKEVETGLKSDSRIGARAYLAPGGPFAGGTLARDVIALTDLAAAGGDPLCLVPSIKASNDQHKLWSIQKLREELGELSGKRIAILGLPYKPGTDTLRRSLAVEVCRQLLDTGAELIAYDPLVRVLPEDLKMIKILSDVAAAVDRADAVLICTEWPQIREARWQEILDQLPRPVVIDANGFIEDQIADSSKIIYRRVGKPKMK